MNKYILLLPFVLASCVMEKSPAEKQPVAEDCQVSVSVSVSASGARTRSSYGFDDCEIKRLSVFVYSGGFLYQESNSQGPALDLRLNSGTSYNIYALANVEGFIPPYAEEDLPGTRLDFMAIAPGELSAIPMANAEPYTIVPGAAGGTLELTLDRLMSCCRLQIVSQLENCSFDLRSVRVRSSAMNITPFRTGSFADSVMDGDYASEEDCRRLSAGEAVPFYVLENCQGVLLPNNTDPAKKVPSEMGCEADFCTYFELEGEWTTPGVSGNLRYRMYLGKDNCRDFSIERNTSSLLRLILTDSGTLTPSWKVEITDYDDTRTLKFSSDELVVWQGGAASTCQVLAQTGNGDPGDVKYALTADPDELEAAGLSYTLSEGTLSVSTSYIGTSEPSAHIVLSSWDGWKTDTLTVRVAYTPGAFSSYSLQRTRYSGQWGRFDFPTASASSPVIFKVGEKSFSVGSQSGAASFYDSASHTAFSYVPKSRRVYYRADSSTGVGGCSVHLQQSTSFAEVFLPAARTPEYLLEDLILDEKGTDYYVSLYLSDENGEALPLEGFAYPAELLALEGRDPSDDRERFADFADEYAGSIFWEWKGAEDADFSELEDNPWWGLAFVADVNSEPSIANDGEVAQFKFWGLEALGDKAMSGTLRLTNEYFSYCPVSEIPLTVNPAFPDQSYLGEMTNYQIAPGDLRSGSAEVPFKAGSAPDKSAVWKIYDAYYTPDDTPAESLKTDSDRHYLASMSGRTMNFKAPTVGSFPACGAFLLEGKVRNAHSGREITGYYTLDVSLYLSVGVQVDFSDQDLLYSFVPFCEYSAKEYSDIWNDNFLNLRIRASATPYASTSFKDTFLTVPDKVSGNTCSYHIGSSTTTGSVDQCCNALAQHAVKGLFDNFHFLAGGKVVDSLILNRTGFAAVSEYSSPSFVTGERGYYRVFRQMDVGNIKEVESHRGFDNLLIEPHLGSFYDY